MHFWDSELLLDFLRGNKDRKWCGRSWANKEFCSVGRADAALHAFWAAR
jgi:hypothetical protein